MKISNLKIASPRTVSYYGAMVTRTEEDTEKDGEEKDIFVETRHVIQVRGNSITSRTI